jgi:hypothetical protein
MPMHPEVACAGVYKSVRSNGGFAYETTTSFGYGLLRMKEDKFDTWDLMTVRVDGENRIGIGTHLIHAFVIDVGPQQSVLGTILHEETLAILRRLGYDHRAIHLHELPFVQLLSKGGISVHKLVIQKTQHPEFDGPYDVYFTGVTGSIPRSFEIVDRTRK